MPSKINLRLPNDLADQLRERAADQKISVNSLILALVAGGIGFKLNNSRDRRATMGTRTNSFETEWPKDPDGRVHRKVYTLITDRTRYHSGDDCCDTLEVSPGRYATLTEDMAIELGRTRCNSPMGGFDAARK